jgi:hypothetical protein
MRVNASGRDADVFDLRDGRVLRRHNDGRRRSRELHPREVLLTSHGPVVVD